MKRKENVLLWVIETGGNLLSYSYTRSIEDIHTRIKILSKKGKNAASAKDSALEKKVGIFQNVEKLNDSYTKAGVKKLAKSMLAEQKTPKGRSPLRPLELLMLFPAWAFTSSLRSWDYPVSFMWTQIPIRSTGKTTQ